MAPKWTISRRRYQHFNVENGRQWDGGSRWRSQTDNIFWYFTFKCWHFWLKTWGFRAFGGLSARPMLGIVFFGRSALSFGSSANRNKYYSLDTPYYPPKISGRFWKLFRNLTLKHFSIEYGSVSWATSHFFNLIFLFFFGGIKWPLLIIIHINTRLQGTSWAVLTGFFLIWLLSLNRARFL